MLLLFSSIFWLQSFVTAEAEPKCFKDFDPEKYNQNRILGGSDCYPGQWPFAVQIMIGGVVHAGYNKLGDHDITLLKGNCTGSIVHPLYILTAAHCLFQRGDFSMKVRPNSDFKVIVGSIKYGKDGIIHEVEDILVHAGYNKLGDHDITLLKLKTPIIFNDLAKSICITKKFPITFKKVFAIGFGTKATQESDETSKSSENSLKPVFEKDTKENYKIGVNGGIYTKENYKIGVNGGVCKFVDIPLHKDEHCLNLPKNSSIYFVPGLEICGGGLWKGTLEGDSGGPLIGQFQDGYYQIGLTARGQPIPESRGNPVDFGVYTKISKYCDWISQQTKNEVVCA
uniref:Peptidase S1 domain-containing protein n=1 Tax=Panagrolaimus sp. ES5 TaxID=591445 RepID=A0AC34FY24_9BILA